MKRIRPIQNQDLDQITLIEFEAFSDPYPKSLFQYLARLSPELFLVAVEQTETKEIILGYIVAVIEDFPQYCEGHIVSIAVSKQHQRKGIGDQLLSEINHILKAKGCNRVALEVRISNYSAKLFYQNYGFREEKRIRKYYGDGEDAIVMVFNLEDEM